MNKILAVVAALAMLPALPAAAATTQIANSSSSAFCSEAAAEGYKRPGGYCDQIGSTNSLIESQDGCVPYYIVSSADLKLQGEVVLVADNCYIYLPWNII